MSEKRPKLPARTSRYVGAQVPTADLLETNETRSKFGEVLGVCESAHGAIVRGSLDDANSLRSSKPKRSRERPDIADRNDRRRLGGEMTAAVKPGPVRPRLLAGP